MTMKVVINNEIIGEYINNPTDCYFTKFRPNHAKYAGNFFAPA
jgi:hypothetical protein